MIVLVSIYDYNIMSGSMITRYDILARTHVRQSKGPGFNSPSEEIAYLHVTITRLSTLGIADVHRGSDST